MFCQQQALQKAYKLQLVLDNSTSTQMKTADELIPPAL